MNKAISARTRNRAHDSSPLNSFRLAAISPVVESKTDNTVTIVTKTPVVQKATLVANKVAETKVEIAPVFQSPNSKSESGEITISIPVLFHINWQSVRKIVKVNLTKLSLSSLPYSYVKDVETGEDIIYYFNSDIRTKGDSYSNYADGYQIKDNTSTKKYRLRGLYKIGYRYIRQESGFAATTFFIELVCNISKPDDYITYSLCEDNGFSYVEALGSDVECETSTMEMFKLILNYKDDSGNSQFKSLLWKGPILSGNTDVPCLDIPSCEANFTTISALVSSTKYFKMDVNFETYLAYEAKGNSLFVYTYNPTSTSSEVGGIYSMINEKNRRLSSADEKSLPFDQCAEFHLKIGSNLSEPLITDEIFRLVFICKQPGRYAGSNFLLSFNLDSSDPNQISSYAMDDTNKLIWSTFLFLQNIPSITEKNFPLDSKIKWTTEKLADDAYFTSPGVISYTKSKPFKSISGDMSKLFLKNHTLGFIEPKNIHIIKLSFDLSLPDN